MDPKQVIVIAVALVFLLAIAWVLVRKQRTLNLRKRFGPEYDVAVRESGSQRAESALLEREKRVGGFSMRELSPQEYEGFQTEWRAIQSHFVDDPGSAVSEADLLVDRLVQARGYPASDFEQRAADISVQHPQLVANYRAAYQIAEQHRQGQAGTEELRNALIYYRSLFDVLLQKGLTVRTKEVA
jgi:hypothetical protein